jgi:glycosyltransferase involved in cell wall biosynthesis
MAWFKESIAIPSHLAAHPQPREIIVVVPAHNEEDRLPACLKSVHTAADRVQIPVTVVVVLDDCTDDSRRMIEPRVTCLTTAAGNVGAARALGFTHAATGAGSDTWLATTDADSLVPRNWLADQLTHHRSGAEAVVGTVRVDWRHHSATTRRKYEQRYGRAGRDEPHGHVHGANLGIRADAYWRVGGFRPLERGEDVDMVDRLERNGARMVWDRTNPVLTSDRMDFRVTGGFGDYVQDLVG